MVAMKLMIAAVIPTRLGMAALLTLAAPLALAPAPAGAQPRGSHPPQHGHHPAPGAHGQHGAHSPRSHGGQGHGQHGARPGQEREDHAHASEADRREVLAVVDRMFAGLAAKDRDAIMAEVVPEGRATANTLGARRNVISEAWPVFTQHIARIPGRPVERLIGPHVHVEGDIAMIWSRYEMELDGRFLHCGVDHFDLIRQGGRWRVLNLTWTQQTEGCPGRRVAQPSGERG
jgi:hypothetical protein